MKMSLLLLLIFFSVITCGQKGALGIEKTSLDTMEYVIIPLDTSQAWSKNIENAKAAKLFKEEIIKVDSLIQECLNYYDAKKKSFTFWNGVEDQEEWRNRNKDSIVDCWGVIRDSPTKLTNYKKQYVPYINIDGEKEVWVNCFCSSKQGWKTNIIDARDGGDCYFNLKINLTKKKYYALHVNGI